MSPIGLDLLEDQSVPRRFPGGTFSHVELEGRIVNSYMNGFPRFPGYLFAILF